MGNTFSPLVNEDSTAQHSLSVSCCRSPDTIFVANGGTILTMDDSYPTAEALAVTKDKITAVGDAQDILRTKGMFTKVVELTGTQTLMPGLIEPHSHPDLFPGVERTHDLSGFKYSSFSEIYPVMKQAVKNASQMPQTPIPWILFSGWDVVLVRDLPALNASWLDENITTDYPVFVLHAMGHSCWVNHLAMDICEINSNTPDPPGGHIDRDSDGNPTGHLREEPAIRLVTNHFPKPGLKTIASAIFDTFKHYSQNGFTSVVDMGTIHLDLPTILGLSLLSFLPKFPVRFGVYYTPTSPVKPSIRYIGKKLWFPGVKIWSDGSPYTGTMACEQPYLKTELTKKLEFEYPNGLLNYTDDELYESLHQYSSELLAMHTQGDRAVTQALDVYERIIKNSPSEMLASDRRYRMEHCGLITEEQMRRAATLGITVTFYTDHVYYYGAALRDEIIGPERASRFMPAGHATGCGIQQWTLHQDSPFSPLSPFLCMKNAVLRKTRQEGKTLGPEYCITIDDALKAYTINAAWQLKREDEIGSLVVGKLADLVLLSQNPQETQPEDLTSIKVEATYLGGHCFKHM